MNMSMYTTRTVVKTGLPALPIRQSARSAHSTGRRHIRVCAELETKEKPRIAQIADDAGLPTEEGIFGFKPFAEVWTGRLAMAGFTCAIVGEFITKKGPLGQIGLITPSPALLVTILAAATAATFTGIFVTIAKAQSGEMSARDAQRYREFLGIKGESKAIFDSERGLKVKGDPVTRTLAPSTLTENQEIQQSRQQGTPADKLLDFKDTNEADKEAAGKKQIEVTGGSQQARDQYKSGMPGPNMSLAYRDDEVERQNFANEPTLRYARQVEIANGRAAMVGFLAAITVEAATGKGVLSQLLWIAKLVGLLGPDSGFY